MLCLPPKYFLALFYSLLDTFIDLNQIVDYNTIFMFYFSFFKQCLLLSSGFQLEKLVFLICDVDVMPSAFV